MRKETINFLAEKLVWVLLAIAPVVIYALLSIHQITITNGSLNINLIDILNEYFVQNDIYSSISSVFGSNGSYPLFSNTLISYGVYLMELTILKFIVKIFVIIPELVNHALEKMLRR